MKCPICGKENNDNWPVEVADKIIDGGCQDCWESQADKDWWEMVAQVEPWALGKRTQTPREVI